MDVSNTTRSTLSGPKPTFFSLPAEIRYMIYALLSLQIEPLILRCSGRQRSRRNRRPVGEPQRHFLQILLVNKQLYAEAGAFFYSNNTFIIGNGWYGSTEDPNLHGLKTFLRRVPSNHISCIADLKFSIYLRQDDSRQGGKLVLGTKPNDLQGVHTIARAIKNHFHGLRTIRIESERCKKRPALVDSYTTRPVSYTIDDCAEMVKVLKNIFTCQILREVKVYGSRFVDWRNVSKQLELDRLWVDRSAVVKHLSKDLVVWNINERDK